MFPSTNSGMRGAVACPMLCVKSGGFLNQLLEVIISLQMALKPWAQKRTIQLIGS